jgi:hypothetical protein
MYLLTIFMVCWPGVWSANCQLPFPAWRATVTDSYCPQTKPCPARRKSSRPLINATTLSNPHSYFDLFSHPSSYRPQNPKVAHLTSQLLASSSASGRSDPDPDALDEEELFAELEAEIENDDGPLREQGLKELQREYGGAALLTLCRVSANLIK